VFYDSLIAKLIAWGDDRAIAVARMRRALDEYRIVGVTTTVPFFRWLFRQPAFDAAEFDTTYLDRLLETREGQPFVAAGSDDDHDAVVAAALTAWCQTHRRGRAGDADWAGEWRRAARHEGLR
jgi:acetyl/propionyl-CoA carboxylase alpha subunit